MKVTFPFAVHLNNFLCKHDHFHMHHLTAYLRTRPGRQSGRHSTRLVGEAAGAEVETAEAGHPAGEGWSPRGVRPSAASVCLHPTAEVQALQVCFSACPVEGDPELHCDYATGPDGPSPGGDSTVHSLPARTLSGRLLLKRREAVGLRMV